MTKMSLSKWARLMALILFTYFVFFAGMSLASHQYVTAGGEALLAIFWLGFLSIMHADALSDAERVGYDKIRPQLDGIMKMAEHIVEINEALAETKPVKKTYKEELQAALVGAIEKVTGGRKPTAKELPAIEREFHEQTGHVVSMQIEDAGLLNAAISKQPADMPKVKAKPHAPRVRKPKAKVEKTELV